MVNPAWTYGKWILGALAHTLQAVVTSPLASTKSTARTMISATPCGNAVARVNCVSAPSIIVLKNWVPCLVRKLAGNAPTGSPRTSNWLKARDGPSHTAGPAVTGHLLLALNIRLHASA